jgi:hypothetical protein
MNKQNIITQYKTSITKLNEVLRALEIDINTEEFLPDQIALLDQLWYLVRQEKKTYQQAIAIVTNQPIEPTATPKQATVLEPELTDFLQQESSTFANHILEQTPNVLKEQQAVARQIIVDSFWKRINELGRSEEFQRKFDAALYGEEILDVSALSGESSARLEGSSSDS